MKKTIARLMQFFSGWKINIPEEYRIKKAVMIAAPHTSNWDLVHAMPGLWLGGYRPKYFIKNSFKKMPVVGWFLKRIGALWVDRSKNNNLIKLSIEMLKNEDELVLMVPAEGTRSLVKKWKLGFYHIAKEAKTPILLAYLDYRKKEAGVGKVIHISGNFEKDMLEIEDFYKTIAPKHPEKYNPVIFERKKVSSH